MALFLFFSYSCGPLLVFLRENDLPLSAMSEKSHTLANKWQRGIFRLPNVVLARLPFCGTELKNIIFPLFENSFMCEAWFFSRVFLFWNIPSGAKHLVITQCFRQEYAYFRDPFVSFFKVSVKTVTVASLPKSSAGGAKLMFCPKSKFEPKITKVITYMWSSQKKPVLALCVCAASRLVNWPVPVLWCLTA